MKAATRNNEADPAIPNVPDTCRTPGAVGTTLIPIPYANLVDGMAAGGDEAAMKTQKALINDAATVGYKSSSATGAALGLKTLSFKNRGKVHFSTVPGNIMVEGGPLVRFMPSASTNAPPGLQVAPSQTRVLLAD